ncbi:hypothetical protein HPP92_025181 [Vanilla planifolia]|uniref:Uncharacterized protein n=1 Tax=Vanilla planifolia TaxID=51239 RepID=A0A835PLR8_VANPL|nr:hypothetical protein HPP92_025181 [Vanilla planifolia]
MKVANEAGDKSMIVMSILDLGLNLDNPIGSNVFENPGSGGSIPDQVNIDPSSWIQAPSKFELALGSKRTQ